MNIMTPNRNLVFACCYINLNRIYLDYAQLWLQSLRLLGNYQGEVLIFSNDKRVSELKDPCNNYSTIMIEPPVDFIELLNSRPFLYKQMDASKYESILFFDIDILVLQDITPLFSYTQDWLFSASRSPINDKYHAGFFYDTETEGMGFNAGVFSCRGDRFNNYMRQWGEIIEDTSPALRKSVPYGDQSFLNLLAATNQNLPIKAYPSNWVIYPYYSEPVDAKTILLHYAGIDKNKAIRNMKDDFSKRIDSDTLKKHSLHKGFTQLWKKLTRKGSMPN